jgi:hypothetical protein
MAADKRKQNKKAQKESEKETVAQHGAKADAAVQKSNETDTAAAAAAAVVVPASKKGLTLLGKFGIFFGFPLSMGMVGLYLAFLETHKVKGRELSFDQDFVVPFLLALAMAIVIGFQTGGYSSSEVTPLIPWPKVKRVKKVVYKNKQGEIVPGPDAKSASTKKDE